MYKIDYNKIFPKNIKELNTIFTLKRQKNTAQRHPVKPTDDNFVVSIPYDARNSSSLRKSLSKYNIGTVFKSTNTLRSILTHTKNSYPSQATEERHI